MTIKKPKEKQTREEDYEFQSQLAPTLRRAGTRPPEDRGRWWLRWNRLEGIRIEQCKIPPKVDGTMGDGIRLRTIRRNRGKNLLTEGGLSFEIPQDDIPGFIEHLKKYV